MALFEYFPNYVWNLSIAMALERGAKIGEIIDMCQPIREAAAAGSDAGTLQFLAHHNWAEVQKRRLQREGEHPVPHYWAHVHWAFGAQNMESFLEKARAMTLEGHLHRVRVPFLVTHGANDRQI